jgi:hypothetical protein
MAMLRQFHCADGTVYARHMSEWQVVTVDEVIAFLEQHRGKIFWNGAAGKTSFRADNDIVSCDLFSYWMERLEDDKYAEFITDWFYGYELIGSDADYSVEWNVDE